MNSIGQRLREARLARGLTQEQLARGLATKGFISQVERERATPSLAKLRLLADRLAMPLAGLTGEQQPQEVAYLRKAAELAVRASEADRALKLLDEARDFPATANERAELLRIRGRALDELGRFEEAIDAHQQAAATAPPDDPGLNAAIYCEMATVFNEQERFSAGVEAGLRALRWLEQYRHADPAVRARILTNLGTSCLRLGQLERAHDFYERGLAAANDAESLYRMANAHMSLAITARGLGKLNEAIDHCTLALQLWSRIDQERNANRVLNNLGDVYYAQGNSLKAYQMQAQCLARAKELGDDLEVAVSGGELARYDYENSELSRSLELAVEAQQAAQRAHAHLHQAYAAAVEGAAADGLGQRRRADRKFREAVGILLQRQAGGKLAEVCAMYAEVLRRRGHQERAFAMMRLAAARDFSKLPRFFKMGT
jgi:transcriptional regulator with XRE-family HTH domain